MTVLLPTAQNPQPLADPVLTREFRRASISDETRRAIIKNWRAFGEWCGALQREPLPCEAETLEAYLVHLASRGLKTATIEQARYSINARHKWAGFSPPGDHELVKTTMAGIRRKLGNRQHRKQALTIDGLRQLSFPKSLPGLRDKAILLLGFAGGFRRSEIAAIQCADIEATPTGIDIVVARSKSDQEGVGQRVSIVRSSQSTEWCPVESLQTWLAESRIDQGAVFRSIRKGGAIGSQISEKSIYLLVKKAIRELGGDPSQYGAHSLRSGCATYLLDRGVPLNIVSQHLRHKRLDTTLKYDRNATAKALQGVY